MTYNLLGRWVFCLWDLIDMSIIMMESVRNKSWWGEEGFDMVNGAPRAVGHVAADHLCMSKSLGGEGEGDTGFCGACHPLPKPLDYIYGITLRTYCTVDFSLILFFFWLLPNQNSWPSHLIWHRCFAGWPYWQCWSVFQTGRHAYEKSFFVFCYPSSM